MLTHGTPSPASCCALLRSAWSSAYLDPLPLRQIPDFDPFVLAGRGGQPPARRDLQAGHGPLVASKHADTAALSHAPHPHRAVIAPAQQVAAVGVKATHCQ